jgi:hypothetical protein
MAGAFDGVLGMMRICKRCFREFDDEDEDAGPVEKLGEIFLKSVDERDIKGYCPECKEEIGIMNVLGFEEK